MKEVFHMSFKNPDKLKKKKVPYKKPNPQPNSGPIKGTEKTPKES